MNGDLHANHRKRMKEKLIMHGGAAFNDHELLEVILYNAIPRKNTNPLAHTLLNSFGSLDMIFNASFEALMGIDGIGESTAAYLVMLGTAYRRATAQSKFAPIKITEHEDAIDIILPEYSGIKEEKMYLLALDKDRILKYKGFLTLGKNATVELCAREILNRCIPVNAQFFYIAHNHPSGIAAPSETDLRSSVLMENILTPMNLLMEDHFIIADGDYVSMRESSMLLRLLTRDQARKIVARGHSKVALF